MEQGFEFKNVDEKLEREKAEFQKFLTEVVEKSGQTFAEYAENYEKETFENYLSQLGLIEIDLKDKKILDVGAARCFFASHALKHGISDQIYSVEPGHDSYADREAKKLIWSGQIKNEIEGKTVHALAQALPFKDGSFNLLVSNAAMPGRDKEFAGGLSMEEDIEKSYDELVRVLKEGGEVRLVPFDPDEDDEHFGSWAKATKKKLQNLMQKGEVSVVLEKINNDESYRIIIKKLKSDGRQRGD